MTAMSARSAPRQAATPPQIPWRRMGWITWRQHRAAVGGVLALFGAVALYLWIAGDDIHHAYAAVSACHPPAASACVTEAGNFSQFYDHTANIVPALLQIAPALAGAFLGAPLLARELETGTYRFTWTQGFERWRWTLAKLVPLAVSIGVAAGGLSLVFSWYYRPFFADGQSTPLTAEAFNLRGVDFAAWTLTAFAIAALAGVLMRRVVPAIVASLVLYAGLAVIAAAILRPHYMTPLVTSAATLPAEASVTGTWATRNGAVAFRGQAPGSLLERLCPPSTVGPGKPSAGTFHACLAHHGYTVWTSYQPATRFWSFQWIETGWLLALFALLIAATVTVVHRRAA